MSNSPYESPQPGQPEPSRYGTSSYDPNAYGGPVTEPSKFGTLKTMTLVSLALYVISQLVGMIPVLSDEGEQAIREQMEATGQTVSDDMINAAIAMSIAIAVILLVVSLAVYLVVYFGLRARKNWARVTGIVFAILGVVVTLASYATDAATSLGTTVGLVSLVIALAWLAANVYWLILAFNSEVRQYLDTVNS